MNTARVMTILRKEAQDIRSNLNITFMFILPIVLTLIYSHLIPDMPRGFALSFGLLFLATMVGMYVPAMIIAEEKEKRTLEVLMLSPATPADIFMGKGMLTLIAIVVSTVVLLLISGNGPANLAVIAVGMTLTSITCIFIGMLIGLAVQNQMATGVIGTPVYMLFMLIPLLAHLGDGFITQIARALPTHYLLDMLDLAMNQRLGLSDMGFHLAFLSGSVVTTFVLLLLVYRYKGLEQG
jgi:ABC-2 type transport system permease protein